MDAQIGYQSADFAVLNAIGGHDVIVGAKQIRKSVSARSARRVFFARNADPAITEPLEKLCQNNNIEYTWVRSMTDLGRACGIEVGAAAAAVLD